MNGKKLAAVCGNILIGLPVSALAVLFVPAASSVGRRVWLKILIALVTLVLSVLLLLFAAAFAIYYTRWAAD